MSGEDGTRTTSGERVRPLLVLPGDRLPDSGGKLPGLSTYGDNGILFSEVVGRPRDLDNRVSVLPGRGIYSPSRGEVVLGRITDVGPAVWSVHIFCPNPATMHIRDTPWSIELGRACDFLVPGDLIYGRLISVDDLGRGVIGLKGRGFGRLSGGHLLKVDPMLIPRLVGKDGATISLLKELTGLRVLLGQNGLVWVNGDLDRTMDLVNVISGIEGMGLYDEIQERITSLLTDGRDADVRG